MAPYQEEGKYLSDYQESCIELRTVQMGGINVGRLRQCWASSVSAIGVMVAGACSGWLQPVTSSLMQDPELQMSEDDMSWLMAVIEVGCLFSPLVSGKLADKYGRKAVFLSLGPLCFLAWLVVSMDKSLGALYLMRLLHGVALGLAVTVQPIYVAEIAEPRIRGALLGIFLISFNLGTLYVFSLGPYLSFDNYVYASLILPLVFTSLFVFCPETPYYLLVRGREDEAEKVLRMFRSSTEVLSELSTMKADIREQMNVKSSWRTLFGNKFERKALIIVQITCIARYLTGSAAIVNYSSETFSRSDSFLPPADMSILLAVTLIIIATVSSFLADSLGRKPLLIASCFGCCVSHLLTGSYYFLREKTTMDTSSYTKIMYLGLVMYSVFSNIGLGPILQTIQAEMFGANTRGLAAGITQGLGAVWCFIVMKIYYTVNDAFGVYLNFNLYASVAFLCGVLLTRLMYETAGLRIGQTEINKYEVDV